MDGQLLSEARGRPAGEAGSGTASGQGLLRCLTARLASRQPGRAIRCAVRDGGTRRRSCAATGPGATTPPKARNTQAR